MSNEHETRAGRAAYVATKRILGWLCQPKALGGAGLSLDERDAPVVERLVDGQIFAAVQDEHSKISGLLRDLVEHRADHIAVFRRTDKDLHKEMSDEVAFAHVVRRFANELVNQ